MWTDNADDEDGFIIERLGATFEEIARVGPNAGNYTDAGRQPFTRYSYRVQSYNANGVSGYSEVVEVMTPAPVPTLSDLSPSSGFATGGTSVQLGGSGFENYSPGPNQVLFGGPEATSIQVTDDTQLTGIAPPGQAGTTVDVTLANLHGSAQLARAFTYFASPVCFQDSDLRVDRAPGAAAASDCEIACDGVNVYAVWSDRRNGAGDIYFNMSADGGSSFDSVDVRLDTDLPGTGHSSLPQVLAAGDSLYVIWVDDRNRSMFDIRFNSSHDGGLTWQPQDTQVDRGAVSSSLFFRPRMAASGDSIYVTWADTRNGKPDVYMNKSSDRGATWLPADLRLNTDAAGTAFAQDPQICVDGDNVYVVWWDSRNGRSDIYLNRSADGGATWLAADVRVDTDIPGLGQSENPQICAAGGSVYVTWRDSRNLMYDVYFNRSTDGGATWGSTDVRVETDPGRWNSFSPRIACAGNTVCVVWADGRKIKPDIYCNSSQDGGATWLASDVRLNSNVAGSSLSVEPRLSISGSDVFVAWRDDRSGAQEIYFNSSSDGGASWQPADLRIQTNLAGLASSNGPCITSDAARIYVLWVDDRGGATSGSDVYFSRNK